MVSGALLVTIGFVLGGAQASMDYLVALLVILLAFAYATVQNDLEDRAIDRVNMPQRPIASGALTLSQASVAEAILLGGLLMLSLYNYPRHLVPVLGILGLIWAYNKPPLQLSRTPFGSLAVLALLYAPIPLAYGYALAQNPTINRRLIGLLISWFLLRWSIAILKDYKDARGDGQFGKQTFYLVFGGRATALVSLGCAVLGFISILATISAIVLPLWPVVFLIILAGWLVYRRFGLLYETDERVLTNIFHTIFFRQNLFDLGVLLWLLLANF